MASDSSTRLPLRFWVVALVAFINSVGFTIIIPLIYPYAKQFGLSDFQASLLTTAYAAAQFLGTPILGRLSDRFGRKPLLIISLLGTAAANGLAAITPLAGLLYLARVVDGLTGGNTSIAKAIISDTTTEKQRTKAFGVFGATFRLGFVAGPPLAFLAQSIPTLPGVSSLGMGFVVAAAMALLAVVLSWIFLPETLEEPDNFKLTWKDFGFGRMLRSIQSPRFGRIFLLTFFSGFTFTIFTFAFQPFFLNVLGQNARSLAVIFAAIGIVGFLTQVFALDPICERFKLIPILATALGARGVLFLLMPAMPNVIAFGGIMVIFGAVNSFPFSVINSLLSTRSGPKEQGTIMGLNSSYLSIANAIGPAVAGLLVSINYLVPFWVAGGLTLLTAGFATTLGRQQQQPVP